MIELCLHIPTIKECKNVNYYSGMLKRAPEIGISDPEAMFLPGTKAIANVRKLFGKILMPLLDNDGKFARMYFGVEFCQRLIPALEELKTALNTADEQKMDFTLLTPYAADEGIKSLVKLFEYLEKSGRKTEVVVNDLGVLKLIHDNYPHLKPVYGRLMSKMTRMPRFAKQLSKRITPEQLKVFQNCSLLLPYYKKFLTEMGVERLEFDIVPQGIKMDFNNEPFRASFYYPWAYITTGRVCEIGSMGIVPEKKFRLDQPCGRECQKYYSHIYKSQCESNERCAGESAGSEYIFQKGNAIFMLCEAPQSVLKNLFSLGFDRVIYEPCFPI